MESPLKYQHRCVSIFDDKKNEPTGFALGSVEGRVAIQYVHAQNPKDNFTFKCHRSNGTTGGYQVIWQSGSDGMSGLIVDDCLGSAIIVSAKLADEQG